MCANGLTETLDFSSFGVFKKSSIKIYCLNGIWPKLTPFCFALLQCTIEIQKDEGCDATDDDSSNVDDNIKKPCFTARLLKQ